MNRFPRRNVFTAPRREAHVVMAMLLTTVALVTAACGASGNGGQSGSDGSNGASALHLRDPGTLTVGIAAIYPPYAFLKPGTKTPEGFEIDITNAVAAELKLQPNYANVEFSTLVPGIQAKRFDVATTGLGDTAQREAQVDFIDYEQTYPALLVAKKFAGEIQSLADMCGHSVAVPKGSTPETVMRTQQAACTQEGKPELNILLYPDHATAVVAVQSGRADATSSDLPTAVYQAKQLSDQFVFVDTHLDPSPLGFAVSKQNPALRDALLNALKKLYQDGTLKQIFTKWDVPQMLREPAINQAPHT